MPLWVYQWHIPLWFAHNWPIILPFAWAIATFFVIRWQWVKLPPAPPTPKMPTWPKLTNSQYWERYDSERSQQVRMRQ